jgi:hypothetical protein
MARRTPKSVKASCDKLFSLNVRSLGYCKRCGNTQTLQCCHIYSRKFGSIRFDYDNAICLCARCHRWGHDNPTEFSDWVGEFTDLVKLKVKKNVLTRRKLRDWLQLESELKNEK